MSQKYTKVKVNQYEMPIKCETELHVILRESKSNVSAKTTAPVPFVDLGKENWQRLVVTINQNHKVVITLRSDGTRYAYMAKR